MKKICLNFKEVLTFMEDFPQIQTIITCFLFSSIVYNVPMYLPTYIHRYVCTQYHYGNYSNPEFDSVCF
jgi:hypothetical protein